MYYLHEQNEIIVKLFKFCLGTTSFEKLELETIKYACIDNQATRFSALFLSKLGSNLVDRQDYNLLKQSANKVVVNSMCQRNFIDALKVHLEHSDIEILLLKSSAFNGYLYELNAPRGNSDIDILVRKNDVNTLNSELSKVAKKVCNKDKSPFANLYESTWQSKDFKGVFIDVHTSPANPILFPISELDLWCDSLAHPLYDSKYVKILSPEKNLLQLCLHMFGDYNFLHHSLFDAVVLVSKTEIDIRQLNDVARRWGVSKLVGLLDYALCSIFGKDSVSVKKSSYLSSLSTKLYWYLFQTNEKPKTASARLKQLTSQYLLLDNMNRAFLNQIAFLKKFKSKIHLN